MKMRKVSRGSARKRAPHPSRPATKKAVDLNALRIEAGKRGEGWCGCKWQWGDDLVGSLVSECAYHAPPPPPDPPLMCVNCRWLEPPETPYTSSSTRRCGSPRQPRQLVNGGPQYGYADVHRGYDFLCGKTARWFEPAPPPEPAPEIAPTNEMGAQAIISPEPDKTFLHRIFRALRGR